VVTTTSAKRSYSYRPERHTGRIYTACYVAPPLAFSVHYNVTSAHYINISAYFPCNVNRFTHSLIHLSCQMPHHQLLHRLSAIASSQEVNIKHFYRQNSIIMNSKVEDVKDLYNCLWWWQQVYVK